MLAPPMDEGKRFHARICDMLNKLLPGLGIARNSARIEDG